MTALRRSLLRASGSWNRTAREIRVCTARASSPACSASEAVSACFNASAVRRRAAPSSSLYARANVASTSRTGMGRRRAARPGAGSRGPPRKRPDAAEQRGRDARLVAGRQHVGQLASELELVVTVVCQVFAKRGEPEQAGLRPKRRPRDIDRQRVMAEVIDEAMRGRGLCPGFWLTMDAQEIERLLRPQHAQRHGRPDAPVLPTAGGDEGLPERMGREPRAHGLAIKARGEIVHHPEEGLPRFLEGCPQGGFHLRRGEPGNVDPERDGEIVELLTPDCVLVLPSRCWPRRIVPHRPQPEHAARIRCPEAEGVLLGEQRLPNASHATQLRHPGGRGACDDGALCSVEGGVQRPEIA